MLASIFLMRAKEKASLQRRVRFLTYKPLAFASFQNKLLHDSSYNRS